MNDINTQSIFIVKRMLKALSFFCILFVFMPSFLVSCSSQTLEVSVMTAVGGVEMSGQKVVDSHPIMLLCLIIPIAIIVLLFIKKYSDNLKAKVIAILGVIDLIIWFVFRATTKRIALENYCNFKTTGWYVMNIIFLFLIICLSGLIVFHILNMESDLLVKLTGNNISKNLNDISNKLSAITDNKGGIQNNGGFCAKCGRPIPINAEFCPNCGNQIVRLDSDGANESQESDSNELRNISEKEEN